MPGSQGANAVASHRLPVLQLVSYVLPSMPLAALGMPIVVYLPQFYASREIGLSLAVTGAVFSILRLLDVFIDPMMGYWSDRLRTRWGRRRPLVLIGAPILAAGIWMVFVPGGPVTVIHLSIWLFIMYVGWSMTMIPHLSWGAELSGDYHERSRVYGWSQAATIAGMVGVLVLPAILENIGGFSLSAQILAMAVFALALLVPSVGLCASVVPEPPVKLKTHAPLLPTLKFLFRDRALRRVIAVDLIVSTSAGSVGAMFFFFARFALGLPHSAGTLLLIYFVCGCIFIPFWIWLSRRIGKQRTLQASFVYTMVAMLLFFFIPDGNFAVAAAVFAFSGVNYGAPSFLLRSMMADVADADAAENSTERAGLMYSFLALTAKFGFGWSVGITFGLLSFIGFDPKTTNTHDAIMGLEYVYISLPIVFSLVNFLIMLGYPLSETKQRDLRARIEGMRASRTSSDGDMPPTDVAPGGAGRAAERQGTVSRRNLSPRESPT